VLGDGKTLAEKILRHHGGKKDGNSLRKNWRVLSSGKEMGEEGKGVRPRFGQKKI